MSKILDIILSIIGWCFIAILLIGLYHWIRRSIRQSILFKLGRNPYRRVCKKCGSCQTMYSSNIEGLEEVSWWEEVYPIGDNPNCECHSYAEYH